MATFKKKNSGFFEAIVYDGKNYDEIKVLVPELVKLNVREVETVGFITSFGEMAEALIGFYVAKDQGNPVILSPAQFLEIADALDEKDKGDNIIKILRAQLKSANLTQSEKGSLITKLSSVFVALAVGEINGARFLCNALTTDAVFTAGRKTFLLNLIDANL